MTPTGDAFVLQRYLYARAAIGLSTGFELCADFLHQHLVLQCSRTNFIRLPSIVATAGHSQQLTHAFDTKLITLFPNQLVAHSLFPDQHLLLFFRIPPPSSTPPT